MASLQTNGVAMKVNTFGFGLQDLIIDETPGNVVFSPFSIYTVLAMLCVGAKGKTKQEIADVLKSEEDLTPLLEQLKPMYNSLLNQSKSKFDAANKAWVGKILSLSASYKNKIMHYLDAEISNIDFSKPEEARVEINDWVAKKTDNKIKDLFPPGSITANAALVLANALYFKGEWEKKFNKDDTDKYDFHIAVNNTVKTDFMYAKDKFAMANDDDRKMNLLELPYAGNSFSMVFAIPHEVTDDYGKIESFDDLDQVLKSMNDKPLVFQQWMQKLAEDEKWQEVEVFVPKFEMNSGFDLNPYLQKLGIETVFQPGAADLSDIVDGNLPELYVSSTYHKSFLTVDEEGTTAAAATGMVANFRMISKEVFLNHPFLFFIVHKESNAIIFSGKVQNPLE